MIRAAEGGGTGVAGVPFCNIKAAGGTVICIVPDTSCAGRLVSADPLFGILDLVAQVRAWRGYVWRLARVFAAGAGNFWPELYRGDGGLSSSFESAVGPAGAGGRAADLSQPGLSPPPLGWRPIGSLRVEESVETWL